MIFSPRAIAQSMTLLVIMSDGKFALAATVIIATMIKMLMTARLSVGNGPRQHPLLILCNATQASLILNRFGPGVNHQHFLCCCPTQEGGRVMTSLYGLLLRGVLWCWTEHVKRRGCWANERQQPKGSRCTIRLANYYCIQARLLPPAEEHRRLHFQDVGNV